jgi:HEAT repeat protein
VAARNPHPLDARNIVLYNVGTGCLCTLGNMVGCYTRHGPGGLVASPRIYQQPTVHCQPWVRPYSKKPQAYLRANYLDWGGGYFDGARQSRDRAGVRQQPVAVPPVRTHTAEEAYELVVAHAGCLPRDAVSRRTVREVLTRTGSWGRHTPDGGLMEGMAAGQAPPDGDGDGMPDAWEEARGLNPADPADAARTVPAGASPGDRHEGYTYVEYYVNELADLKIAAALTEARLRREPVGPWEQPARGLAPGAMLHKTPADMVRAIREQTAEKNWHTHEGWYAVQQLERMGAAAAEAVPGLVEALGAADPRTVSFAAWGLGAIGPAAADRAVPALMKVLERKDYTPKGGKAWKTFYPESFAAWALGRMGERAEPAVPLLAKQLNGPGSYGRSPAGWALAQIGPGIGAARAELIKALGKTGAPLHFSPHQLTARALANIGEAAVPDLSKQVGGGNPTACRGAAMALGLIGPGAKAAVPALLGALGSAEASTRSAAALALPKIAPSAGGVVAGLAKLLADEDYAVRNNAARALGACGPAARDAVPALVQALGDERREVVRAAALALGGIGEPATGALTGLLGGQSAFVRKYAARALGGGADPAAVSALVKALGDSDAEVRREAVWSLGRLGAPARSAVKDLERLAGDDDYVVRYAAAEVARRLGE